MDRMTGRSKGFGFVEMNSNQEAQTAMNALNGQDHNGRSLIVNEARPRESRGGGRGGPRGGGGKRRSWWFPRIPGTRSQEESDGS